MATQMSIYDFVKEVKNKKLKSGKRSRRLVDDKGLTTDDYNVLGYLKRVALGSKNKVSGRDIAKRFGFDNTAQVRRIIKTLRTNESVHVKIGSDPKGYWIPTQQEYIESVQLMLNKTLSQIETTVNMYPRAEKIIQAVAGAVYKGIDKAAQGQVQIDFNGWEEETINHFAEKYIKRNEEKA
jgi:hypothetical protein